MLLRSTFSTLLAQYSDDSALINQYWEDLTRSYSEKGLALEKMRALGVLETEIDPCKTIILATQGHQISDDPDTNLFTDADLSILGFPWPQYEQYALQVRREYARYPDFLYNPGRKKVLRHFLLMERIFKTPFFFEQYEAQARHNLERELAEGIKI